MFENDLENRYITFNFPKDISESPVRFTLYNERNGGFPVISDMHSKNDSVKIDTLSLEPHFQYKYKYQIRKNGFWVTAKPYKHLHINFKNENNVQYRFFKEPASKFLLVVFSGNGSRPAYNYIGAFSNLRVNRLHIKDDFTTVSSNNSVIYIGNNRKNEVMIYISNLINKFAESLNIDNDNIICCGSSKGGYASILYALTYGYGHCVVGSPTLYLGNSLLVEGSIRDIAKAISGNINNTTVDWLNNILLSKIPTATNTNIHIIIGNGERRYHKHVVPFVNQSKINDALVYLIQEEDFDDHDKIGVVYPPFANKNINKIIE